MCVSIHAPGRGATNLSLESVRYLIEFQFTHPGGVRLLLYDLNPRFIESFNSRTREGCDGDTKGAAALREQFQFTHPGGVRLMLVVSELSEAVVSIHAPGRGATYRLGERLRRSNVSIHAPGRGATPTSSSPTHSTTSFNSRTREGCDQLGC